MLRDLLRESVRRLIGCRHKRMHRERRTRFGCEVLHYVCEDCGHAVPIVNRTEAETHALFDDAAQIKSSS
jgi:predicted site-specific integrase-resolvase